MIKTSNKNYILHGISCATCSYSCGIKLLLLLFANAYTHIYMYIYLRSQIIGVHAMCHLWNGRHKNSRFENDHWCRTQSQNTIVFRVNLHLMSDRVRHSHPYILLIYTNNVDNTPHELAAEPGEKKSKKRKKNVEYSHSSLLLLSLVWCRELKPFSPLFFRSQFFFLLFLFLFKTAYANSFGFAATISIQWKKEKKMEEELNMRYEWICVVLSLFNKNTYGR